MIFCSNYRQTVCCTPGNPVYSDLVGCRHRNDCRISRLQSPNTGLPVPVVHMPAPNLWITSDLSSNSRFCEFRISRQIIADMSFSPLCFTATPFRDLLFSESTSRGVRLDSVLLGVYTCGLGLEYGEVQVMILIGTFWRVFL